MSASYPLGSAPDPSQWSAFVKYRCCQRVPSEGSKWSNDCENHRVVGSVAAVAAAATAARETRKRNIIKSSRGVSPELQSSVYSGASTLF